MIEYREQWETLSTAAAVAVGVLCLYDSRFADDSLKT